MQEIAPDGSSVRLLARTERASMIACTLAPGAITRAVAHRSVQEFWYCVRGSGRLWRANSEQGERTDDLAPGRAFTIAAGTRFQFRNDGADTLELIITTIPAWPGACEALRCGDHWPATL